MQSAQKDCRNQLGCHLEQRVHGGGALNEGQANRPRRLPRAPPPSTQNWNGCRNSLTTILVTAPTPSVGGTSAISGGWKPACRSCWRFSAEASVSDRRPCWVANGSGQTGSWSPKFSANPYPANPLGCWVQCEGRPPHKQRLETEREDRGHETGSKSGCSVFAFHRNPRPPWPPAGCAKRESTFCPWSVVVRGLQQKRSANSGVVGVCGLLSVRCGACQVQSAISIGFCSWLGLPGRNLS